jgi:spore maturation protein B
VNTAFLLIVPLILSGAAIFALSKNIDVFAALTDGASEGLRVVLKILPPLVALLTAVYMLRASGATDALARACTPLLVRLGIPPETAALIFIRPLSGSGALAVGSELIGTYGPDSLVGRTAAVMLGSTETTFYTIAVYFGAVKIKKTRHAIPAALAADFTGFFMASLTVRLLFF